jgi:hypothetical protein
MARRPKYDQDLVVWEPQPGPQSALITCPAWEVFFGGARGGGKTDAILGEFIGHAQQYGEGASGLVVRRTRTELLDTIERSRQIYSPLGAKFNQTDALWRFPNGARLQFIYLEQDSDADRYQGRSVTRLYVEEAGTFPSEKPILKLIACVRSGKGVPTRLIMTGNPGGAGQHWLKARYIDPHPAGYKIMEREFDNPFNNEKLKRTWCFIPSKVYDNKYLGADYIAGLQMMGSPALVRAMLMGDWDAVEGAFFDCWDINKHVVVPFEISPDWHRFRSMDWGSASPFSVGWWAVVGEDVSVRAGIDGHLAGVLPRGCLVRYREWYGASAPNTGLKLTAEQVAQGILDRQTKSEANIRGVIDPSAFKEDGGPSIAERMAALGVYFRRADNKRVGTLGAMGGWDQMRQRLIGDHEGRPMIACFNTCVASMRTIPVLQHDDDRPEDLLTSSEDHAADEWRYACMSRPYIIGKKAAIKKIDTGYRARREPPKAGGWAAY